MQRSEVTVPLFVIEHFEDGALILNTFDSRMIKINTSGSKIIQLFESGCSENEVEKELVCLYDITSEEAAEAVDLLNTQLAKHSISIESLY